DKSAFDKNLNANANSTKPKTTFIMFNHPPDFGNVFNQPGKAANNPKGNAKASEKPNIPIIGVMPPVLAAFATIKPRAGPVQEKETSARTNAIKKIPISPPLSALLSALLIHLLGIRISNAPINEIASTTRIIKNARLNQKLVDITCKIVSPN